MLAVVINETREDYRRSKIRRGGTDGNVRAKNRIITRRAQNGLS